MKPKTENCTDSCPNSEDHEDEPSDHKDSNNTSRDEMENSSSEDEEESEDCNDSRDLNGNVTKYCNNITSSNNINTHTIDNINTSINKNMNVTKLPTQGFSPSSLELLVRLFPEKKKSVLELVLKRCGDDLLKAIEQCVPLGNAYINRCRKEETFTGSGGE